MNFPPYLALTVKGPSLYYVPFKERGGEKHGLMDSYGDSLRSRP